MYDLVKDSDNIQDLNSWLAFGDRDGFNPIEEGWITVYRTGHKRTETNLGEIEQGFRIHCFLINEDHSDALSDIDPFGEIPEFDFYPMAYGGRKGEEYWEEALTQPINGIEAKRFVMKFTKDAPLVDTGFIEYHDLVEQKKT